MAADIGRGVPAALLIQSLEGLVQQQKLRPAAHRPGNGYPAAHSAGQLRHRQADAVGQAQLLQML